MYSIFTDHLNITTEKTTPDCIISWLNYIEQCHPVIHFTRCKDNAFVNTLSHLDHVDKSLLSKAKQTLCQKEWILPLIHSFLHIPPMELQNSNLTDYKWMFKKQNSANALLHCTLRFPDWHFNEILMMKRSFARSHHVFISQWMYWMELTFQFLLMTVLTNIPMYELLMKLSNGFYGAKWEKSLIIKTSPLVTLFGHKHRLLLDMSDQT